MAKPNSEAISPAPWLTTVAPTILPPLSTTWERLEIHPSGKLGVAGSWRFTNKKKGISLATIGAQDIFLLEKSSLMVRSLQRWCDQWVQRVCVMQHSHCKTHSCKTFGGIIDQDFKRKKCYHLSFNQVQAPPGINVNFRTLTWRYCIYMCVCVYDIW